MAQSHNQNPYSAKAAAAKAIMSSPKLAQLMHDAFEAAPGSTKKEAAMATLKAVYKAHSNFNGAYQPPMPVGIPMEPVKAKKSSSKQDGSGGPGPATTVSYPPNATSTVKGVAQTPFGQVNSPGQGQEGPGNMDDAVKNFQSSYQQTSNIGKLGGDIAKGVGPAINETARIAGVGASGVIDVALSPFAAINKAFGWAGTDPNVDVPKESWMESRFPTATAMATAMSRAGDQPMSEKERINKMYDWAMEQARIRKMKEKGQTPGQAEATGSKPDTTSNTSFEVAQQMAEDRVAAGESATDVERDIFEKTGHTVHVNPGTTTGIPGQGSPGDHVDANGVQGILNKYGKEGLDAWYNALDPSAKEYYKDLYQYVGEGRGVDAWTMHVMSNKPLLAKMMGVPESELSNFPTSGLLSDQILDLRDNLKQEYQLDNLLNQIMNKEISGANIKDDLQSYVRGKDEYLGTIDRLMEEAQVKMGSMDMSNPNVAKRMNNYMNYLTTLYGRQNQRYIGYLDSSINMHEADLDRLKAVYNTNAKQMQEDFEALSLITTEDYNRIKTNIDAMYNLLDERTTGTGALTEKQMDYYTSLFDLAKKASEAEEAGYKATEAKNKSTNPDDDTKFDTNEQMTRLFDKDSEGNITMRVYDPAVMRQYAKDDEQGIESTKNLYYETHNANLTKAFKTGSFSNELAKYLPGVTDGSFRTMVKNGLLNASTPQEAADIFSGILADIEDPDQKIIAYGSMVKDAEDFEDTVTMVHDAAYKGFQEYLAGKTEELKKVIQEISGKGWFNRVENDKAKFLEKDSAKELGVDVAGLVYDYYTASKTAGAEMDKMDPSELAAGMSGKLADYVTNQFEMEAQL